MSLIFIKRVKKTHHLNAPISPEDEPTGFLARATPQSDRDVKPRATPLANKSRRNPPCEFRRPRLEKFFLPSPMRRVSPFVIRQRLDTPHPVGDIGKCLSERQ